MSFDPNLTVNSFVSDNADTSIALNGDKITLNFGHISSMIWVCNLHISLLAPILFFTTQFNKAILGSHPFVFIFSKIQTTIEISNSQSFPSQYSANNLCKSLFLNC